MLSFVLVQLRRGDVVAASKVWELLRESLHGFIEMEKYILLNEKSAGVGSEHQIIQIYFCSTQHKARYEAIIIMLFRFKVAGGIRHKYKQADRKGG